jgi:hypothetical protein
LNIALCALTDSTITVKGEHNQDVCNVQGKWGIIPSANAPLGNFSVSKKSVGVLGATSKAKVCFP